MVRNISKYKVLYCIIFLDIAIYSFVDMCIQKKPRPMLCSKAVSFSLYQINIIANGDDKTLYDKFWVLVKELYNE